MPQFFITKLSNKEFTIEGKEAHHLIKSHRIKVNETVNLLTANGKKYKGVVKEITRNTVKGEITCEIKQTSKNFHVHLFQALIKKDKFELILQKATELGVDEITPIVTSRVQYKNIKPERLKKIIIEATKQCMRDKPPVLNGIKEFKDVINSLPSDQFNLLAHESEQEKKLSTILLNEKNKNINVFIGPEGGFTDEEISLAKSKNIKIFSLGKNILRSETAAISAIALITLLLD